MYDPACLVPQMPMPLWIFAYGSLMWQPDFPVAERRVARAEGWSRSFCMWSIHHRGTPEQPGLVLAMEAVAGAICEGVALRVPDGHEPQVLEMLRARELVSSAYVERALALDSAEGPITALAYVIAPDHVQYARDLALSDQARIIAQAKGGRGPNADYLYATVAQLQNLGLRDAALIELAAAVRACGTEG